jgi:hypothetical protein
VRFVEDRDIWAWQYPESAGFLAALDMEPFEFARWNEIAQFDDAQRSSYIERGCAMDEKFTRLATELAEGAQAISFNGVSGLMVNVPGVFHSLVGETLSKRSGTFALMWSVDKGGIIKVGLRSQRSFDCIPWPKACAVVAMRRLADSRWVWIACRSCSAAFLWRMAERFTPASPIFPANRGTACPHPPERTQTPAQTLCAPWRIR